MQELDSPVRTLYINAFTIMRYALLEHYVGFVFARKIPKMLFKENGLFSVTLCVGFNKYKPIIDRDHSWILSRHSAYCTTNVSDSPVSDSYLIKLYKRKAEEL